MNVIDTIETKYGHFAFVRDDDKFYNVYFDTDLAKSRGHGRMIVDLVEPITGPQYKKGAEEDDGWQYIHTIYNHYSAQYLHWLATYMEFGSVTRPDWDNFLVSPAATLMRLALT